MGISRWADRLCVASLALMLCTFLGGCIEMIKQELTARFVAEFACESPEVNRSTGPGLFRVEGCDQVAFYYCDPQRCRLEHSRAMTEPERLAVAQRERAKVASARALEQTPVADADFGAPRQVVATQREKLQPLGTVETAEWRIELASLPDSMPFVLWRFHAQRPLSASPCRPTISHDGQVIPTETIRSHSAYDAEFLIKAVDFESLRRAQAVKGVICGVDFALDEAARSRLAGFPQQNGS
jgi:hypothetical protein